MVYRIWGDCEMRVGRRLVRLVPTVAVTAAISVIAALAVNATGQKVLRVEANNAALWVTSNQDDRYGRFNKASSSTELTNRPGEAVATGSLDVSQDGNTVVVRDDNAGKLIPVDTASGTNGIDTSIELAANAKVDLRGGTLAVLDPASGKLWALRTAGTAHQLDLSAIDKTTAPLAELGPVTGDSGTSAGVSVGADGSVHAASASGKQVTVPVTDSGFGQPAYSDLASGLKGVEVAALGAQSAVLATGSGTLVLPGGKSVQLPGDGKTELQQGGADLGSVAVATSSSLLRVAYDGTITTLYSGANGAPAQPVNLGSSAVSASCILGAWAGDPGKVARSCNGQPAQELPMDRTDPSLFDPVFRVSWNLVLLNDRLNGRIYDVDLQKSLDDWKTSDSEEQKAKDEKDKDTTKPTEAKPKAKDDAYGARPDRTSVLHVLDNDSDPNGKVLSITEVTQPKNGATVVVAPDGQTLQYAQPEDGADGSFRYTISNGVATASATVSVKAENASENQAPAPWAHYEKASYAVAAAGTVTMPVAGDFRDFDGDPITVIGATDGKDDVPVTSDGQIEYTAPSGKKDQTRTVRFQLTDGNSPAQGFEATIKIAGTDNTTGIAPIAQADAVIGAVGQPITVLPLANDIPGVDPGNEDTHMTLASDIEGWKGATITTDRDAGRVTIVSKAKGIHYLKYTVAFGSADTATGMIRVDVRDKVDDKPIAMPDQAVIRGPQPITVDVLANDSDPHGGLLTVQTASASNEGMLQVAVIKGRWLRIVPQSAELKPNPLSITYQVINGEGALATGSVVITHLPALPEDAPLVRGDTATVRAGDSTLIPVLANDLTLGGSTLTLATTVGDAPTGQLPVTDLTKDADADQGDVGKAYVSGSQVRYVAPAKVDAPEDVTITYIAQAGKRTAQGEVTVTVNPEPTDANPDSPPQPTSIEARATSGDTITIPVPASAQDPDGDSVALVGLASGPALGRVTAISPKGITYQAFPTEDGLGTDSFQYVVTDRYGQTGTGTVRVAVVPPGQTQVPVPVDDALVARPGSTVQVDVIANDLIAMSDKVKILPLKDRAGVSLAGDQGPIVVTVPAAGAEPLSINYQLTGNGGNGPLGALTVEGEDGALNPPHLQDQVATVSEDGKTASVDVLANAWDTDGPASSLTVKSVSSPDALVNAGTVTIPVLPQPQVLSYEVDDGDGAAAAALIYVPSSGDGLPYAHGTIQLDEKKTTVSLADYITSPRGKPIRITVTDTVSVSPSAHLKVKPNNDLTKVELSVDDVYVGPATLNLEVTDGTNLTDPEGKVAVVSVPIQVGPVTPVLRCPTDPQYIVRGTTGKAMDLLSLCHVWTADPAAAAGLSFAASWTSGEGIANVTPSIEGQSLVLQATGEASPGGKASLKVEIPGTATKPGTLTVVVKDAPLPTYKPQTKEVKQGETVSGTIELDSPINVGRKDVIVAMPHLAGAAESFTPGTGDWSVTADPNSDGRLAYDLTLSDVANTAVTDRQIHGTLTVSVYGIPAAPAAPTSGKTAQNHAVTLTWKTPANHGATIERYEVKRESDDTTWPCDANTCTIKPLQNNVAVQFRVRAYNKAGWSDWGDLSGVFKPDQVPSAVTGFKSSNPLDRKITLSWNAVNGDFSPVTKYEIRWAGGHATATGTSATVSAANKKTTFSIWAWNHTGKSKKAATTTGWPSGAPSPFRITSVDGSRDVDSSVVTISWEGKGANGEPPLSYSVSDNGSPVSGCQSIRRLQCKTGAVVMDGSTHSYEVTAKNKPGIYATTSPATSWVAVGIPERPGRPSLAATGNDGEFDVGGTVGNSRGKTSKVKVSLVGYSKEFAVSGTTWSGTIRVGAGANGTPVTITAELCNESYCSTSSAESAPATAYGPVKGLSIQQTGKDGTKVNYQVSVSPNGLPLDVEVNGQSLGTTDASGTWSKGGSYDTGGYNRTVTMKVTVSDSKRGSTSDTQSMTSAPNPPSVAVSRGDAVNTSTCTSSRCHYVVVTIANFSGSQSCQITYSDRGTGGFTSWSQSNGAVQTENYFGGYTIEVVCGGVSSGRVSW